MADISKIDNGTEYNLKDAAARAGIESSKTLKSSVVTVTDAAPINAEDITVDITPIQDLHGYDRPWAGGAGKNKADTESASKFATGASTDVITLTKSQTSLRIQINGATYSGAVIDATLPEAGTYTLNCSWVFNTSGYGCIQCFDSNDTKIFDSSAFSSNGSLNGRQITVSEAFMRIRFFGTWSGSTGDITYSNIQLEKGSSATTFAPYSNICPIEGWTGAELDRVGKNLYDKNATDTNKGYIDNYYLSSNGNTSYNALWTVSEYIPIVPNDSYRLAYIRGDSPGLCFYDANKSYISGETYGGRVIFNPLIPSNARYIRLSIAKDRQDTAKFERFNQYTASFGETVYGGKWHVTKGGTDKTYGYVDLGDCDWAIQSIDGNNCFRTTLQNKTFTENAICSQYSYSPRCRTDETFSTALGAAASLYVRDSRYSDTTAFKTAMSGVQLVYELKTPTTISTPKQNVPMLQGINTVYADCGDTQLKYQPDNVIGELKGEIRAVEAELAEVEENLEIVYEDHVANTSMGIIVDGYSVGDMPFSNALDIAKTGYTPIAVTDTSIVHSTVANQGEIATHCLLDVANNRVRFYVHVMDSAASLTIPPNSLTFRVAYKKA